MEQLYVGVVAFNQRVFLKPITSDVAVVKTFINEQINDKDQTSIAYAASRGNQLFEANDLPKFDKVYMLNFTDGFDNFSSRLWRDSIGRVVNKDYVYDTARYDLLQHAGTAACPANAVEVVKAVPGIIHLTKNGGDGAIRELCEMILAAKKNG